MSDTPTQADILVDVEPANKTFRIRVENATTVDDLVKAILESCAADGINVRGWARDRVGRENISLVLMRKAQGNAALPPAVEFGQIQPVVQPDERFSLDATAIVG